MNPLLIRTFSEPQKPSYPFRGWAEARSAVAGGLGMRHPEPPDYDAQIDRFFAPVETGDPVREREQRRQFAAAWKNGRIMPTGRIIQQNPEREGILYVHKDAFELRVPCELQTPGSESSGLAARGTVVLRCDDPAFVARVNELRAAADTDPLVDLDPAGQQPGAIPWKIVRVESDMKPVPVERGPGSPGGPGPGGM
jgi:hypothetical protein